MDRKMLDMTRDVIKFLNSFEYKPKITHINQNCKFNSNEFKIQSQMLN